ncbi:SgcJ/EcaC family oxidoreductase [Auritidibacter sp. NML100628]|uniref:SgcJ/EcaC family oxidoreductase n=1 Tax=Auritidibacter sp. NML100628 TaxID=2170742 RepID=UPI000D72768A|nr:SgcJ/EcaC family oxidoreductase [Auritidibacter sp. NML100628]PXA77707.1 hypothetical protein DCC24_01930 [Auritidibacter sp. NML100628]PXA80862.1 hypothetical protein DCC26_03215 [Auritidibacter sp. NML120779]
MYLSTPDQPISLAAPKNIIYAFQQAWNQHDDHHLAKLFVADASFVSDTGLWWTGHDEIQRAHAEDFQGPLRAANIIVGRVELRMLGDRHAMVQARITMTGHHDRTVPADHPPSHDHEFRARPNNSFLTGVSDHRWSTLAYRLRAPD